jgi:hypothetical protein
MMMRRMGMMLACFFLFAAVAGSAPAEISYMFHIPPTTPEFKIYEGLLELFMIKNPSIRPNFRQYVRKNALGPG